MKRHFLPIAAAAFAAALSSSNAQTVIRIVASNGDRTATQTAISKLLAPGWSFNGTNGFVNTPAGLSNATTANFGAWSGSYNGNPVIIKVSFSGALAGIAAVAGNTDQRFVPTNGTNDGVVVNPLTTATFEIGKADFGFSTNFQSTSPFNGVFQGVNYAPVIEEVVGVSPLGFYASPGFPASGANITTQLAQLLYTSGSVSLAQFTGDFDNDVNKIVYGLGRNTDAGQRFGAHTEIGLGTTKNVLVWFPSVSGRTTTSGITYGGTVSSHQLWPVNQQQGTFPVPLGSGGYSSGALLAENLTVTLGPDAFKNKYFDDELGDFTFQYPNAIAGFYIGYLTPGDANNRVLGANNVVPPANRGIALKYNGVDLTDANVRSGKYTAWLYNRILKPQSGLTGLKLTFANALRDQIRNVDAPFGGGLFDDASFKVFRSTDGGLVIPK